MNIFDKIYQIFSSGCKKKKEDFVIKSEIKIKPPKSEFINDEGVFFQTPLPPKQNDLSLHNERNTHKIDSISFCERLFKDNDYEVYSQKKSIFKREEPKEQVFIENNVDEEQVNPVKVLDLDEKSEELFTVVEKLYNLVDKFHELDLETTASTSIEISYIIPQEKQISEENFYRLYDRTINSFLVCKSNEEKMSFFPKISFEEFVELHRVWNQTGNLLIEIVKHEFVPEKLSYKNLQTLSGSTWLNDEVVNSYVRLIMNDIGRYSSKNIRIFNTFFFTELEKNYNSHNTSLSNPQKILRIAKKFNVDAFCDLIFIPINIHNNHWISLEIDLNDNNISYLDSFNVSEKEALKYFKIIEKLMILLENNNNVQNRKWKFIVQQGFPKQKNSSDCGVFMLKGIHYRSLRSEKMFTQKDIPYFRMLITIELVKGKLLNSC